MSWLTPEVVQGWGLSEADIDTLTYTALGEAAGESDVGKAAVIHTILNRTQRYGQDPVSIATGGGTRYKTYSTWNAPADQGNSPIKKFPKSSEPFRAMQSIVYLVLGGKIPDPTGGATHYWNPNVITPYWADEETTQHGRIRIGDHVFLPRTGTPQKVIIPPGLIANPGADYPVLSNQRTGWPTPLAQRPRATSQIERIAPVSGSSIRSLADMYADRNRVGTTRGVTDLRLQRATDRVAAQRRVALTGSIRAHRVNAFAADPFEIGPSGARITPKRDMSYFYGAGGTNALSARMNALNVPAYGMDAPGLTLLLSSHRPPAVTNAPWAPQGVARVAAGGVTANRNSVIIADNRNVHNSVRAFLEAGPTSGKTDRPFLSLAERYAAAAAKERTGTNIIVPSMVRTGAAATPGMQSIAAAAAARARATTYRPGQSIIERFAPRPGQSIIERSAPGLFSQTFQNTRSATSPGAVLAANMAANINRTGMSLAERYAAAGKLPGQSQIERDPPRMVTTGGVARIIPQSQIERTPNIFTTTFARTSAAYRTGPEMAINMIKHANRVGQTPAQIWGPTGNVKLGSERLVPGLPYSTTAIRRIDPIGPQLPLGNLVPRSTNVIPGQSIIERNPPPRPLTLVERFAAASKEVHFPTGVAQRDLARESAIAGKPNEAGQKLAVSGWPTLSTLRPPSVSGVTGFPTSAALRPTTSPSAAITGYPTARPSVARPSAPAGSTIRPLSEMFAEQQRAVAAQQSRGGGLSGGSSSGGGGSTSSPRFELNGREVFATPSVRYNTDTNKFENVTVFK